MEFTILDLSDDFFDGVESELIRGFNEMKIKYSKISDDITSATPTKITSGHKEFKTLLSADLYTVFKFVRGQVVQPAYIHDIVQNVAELAWHRPFIDDGSYDISWSKWQETHNGFLCKLALDRIDLVVGRDLQKNQIANLIGLSRAAVTQQLDVPKADPVTSKKKKPLIKNSDALNFIKSKDIVIKSGSKEYKPYEHLNNECK